MKDGNNNSNKESSKKSKGKCKRGHLPDLPHLLLSRHVMDEFSVRFCSGSLVWAKVSGHPDPPWPGIVTEVIREVDFQQPDPEKPHVVREIYQDRYKVFFFATDDWAIVRESNLWHYHDHDVDYAQKAIMKLEKRHDRLKMFQKALRKIKYEYHKKFKEEIKKEKSHFRTHATVLNPVYDK